MTKTTPKTWTLLLDNGHGKDTKGKRSPEITPGVRLLEWDFTRKLSAAVQSVATSQGLKAVQLVPEENDVPLTTRGKRANAYIKAHPSERCVLYSLHGNAAGNGGWCSARGWECWTTRGQNNSDRLAEYLYQAIADHLPGAKLRKDKSDGDSDKEADFTVIKLANCPAVLSENFFYDNKDDVALMLSPAVIQRLACAHVDAAVKFFEQ